MESFCKIRFSQVVLSITIILIVNATRGGYLFGGRGAECWQTDLSSNIQTYMRTGCPTSMSLSWISAGPSIIESGVTYNIRVHFKTNLSTQKFGKSHQTIQAGITCCLTYLGSCVPSLNQSSALIISPPPISANITNGISNLTLPLRLDQGEWNVVFHIRIKISSTKMYEMAIQTAKTVPTTASETSKNKAILSNTQIIIISVFCSVAFFCLLCTLFYFLYLSPSAKRQRHRSHRLLSLPIHRLLYHGYITKYSPLTDTQVMETIHRYLPTAIEFDYDGYTALDIIFNKKNKLEINEEIIYTLLKDTLNFELHLEVDAFGNTSVAEEGINYTSWAQAVQMEDDLMLDVVERILGEKKQFVELLANAKDRAGRKCRDIACPTSKDNILRKTYLFERYEILDGPSEHRSKTSLVVFAVDHQMKNRGERASGVSMLNLNNANANFFPERKKVAMKFMRDFDQFQKEVRIREEGQFEDQYVLPILASFNADDFSEIDHEFRQDAIVKGFVEYPYCIVLEAATQSLKRIIDHEHIAGMRWDTVREMVKHLSVCLDHIHTKGFIHGDLKPLNLLLVGNVVKVTILKLADLDAAANIFNGESFGYKYSSGYVPPEGLWLSVGMMRASADEDESGLDAIAVGVRSELEYEDEYGIEFDPLLADPSQDMWALGCVLYLLCTGCTLFHVNTEDHIVSQDDLLALYNWDNITKQRKLSTIRDKHARNLVSLLLSKDPRKRPSATRVLAHPFITGKHSSRLQGDSADYDIFLSYRVSSDLEFAEALYRSLTASGLRVWMDKHSLQLGQNWEEGFCRGLVSSANFVCLLSRNAIKNLHKESQNFELLTESSHCDNLLLEWRLALELKERGMLTGVFPVMIGDKDVDTGLYSNYFIADCHTSALQSVTVTSVEMKLREHLEREGLGLPYCEDMTVKSVVEEIICNQGGFLEGQFIQAIKNLTNMISTMIKQKPYLLSLGSSSVSDISPKKPKVRRSRTLTRQASITVSGQARVVTRSSVNQLFKLNSKIDELTELNVKLQNLNQELMIDNNIKSVQIHELLEENFSLKSKVKILSEGRSRNLAYPSVVNISNNNNSNVAGNNNNNNNSNNLINSNNNNNNNNNVNIISNGTTVTGSSKGYVNGGMNGNINGNINGNNINSTINKTSSNDDFYKRNNSNVDSHGNDNNVHKMDTKDVLDALLENNDEDVFDCNAGFEVLVATVQTTDSNGTTSHPIDQLRYEVKPLDKDIDIEKGLNIGNA